MQHVRARSEPPPARPQGTHSVRSRGNLPVDVQRSEGGVSGQTFVPFTRPRLRDRLHEVLLQLADVGVVLLDFFLGLI